ncbi:cytochrome oxidase small assembly protein [Ottowia sp. SB7-C50]
MSTAMSDEQRRRNVRLGLILGTVALVFFIGFIVRMVVLGR